MTAVLPLDTRYTRSVHLQRDYASRRQGLAGYQVTPLVIQTAERVIGVLAPAATARAFSLVGPYGSGKSAFAVFLAHLLERDPARRHSLIRDHSSSALSEQSSVAAPRLLPVLLSGNNSALRPALLAALHKTLVADDDLATVCQSLLKDLNTAVDDPQLDPQQVADLFEQAAQRIAQSDLPFAGLLLIVDELGQFLDYAARQQNERDLFVLQTLAEAAARSGKTPLVLLTILHQSFEHYSGTAGPGRRAEWAKVQGRFVDLPFQETDSQMLRMIGRALSPDRNVLKRRERRSWAEQMAPLCEQLKLRPPDISTDQWQTLLKETYPLHPTVLLALPIIFRQLAQNERSLFAFLSSQEAGSLSDTLQQVTPGTRELPIYRLPQLYAYVEASLGPTLFGRARGRRWSELAEARNQLPEIDPPAREVLTCAGLLNAFGQQRHLRASSAQLSFALRDRIDDPAVMAAISELVARRQMVYRRFRDSYVLYEGSDLDLVALIESARSRISDQFSLVQLLHRYATPTPLIARRHSYQTGAVRHFKQRFVDVAELAELRADSTADGEIVAPVPADDEDLELARLWANAAEREHETWRIVVLPERVHLLRDTLIEAAAMRQVLAEQPELQHDAVARRELASQAAEADQTLQVAISTAFGPGRSHWYWCGQLADVGNERRRDELLSKACDATFPTTPQIWNELIVRRQLSSAAAKARRNLIEAMLDHGHEENCGISGYPPERAIYESVLKAGGIHRRHSDNVWRFGPPEPDHLGLQPVWQAIQKFFDVSCDNPRPLLELHQLLTAPPYGIKAGLIPLLFMAAYLANAGEIALYEHGNFVAVPDIATFERMLRQPGYFALRQTRASGLRLAVYERLARALAPQALGKPVQPAVMDAIRPLLRFVATLPAYSRNTRSISEQARAIRQAIAEARAPDQLIFEALPRACGLPPFAAEELPDDKQVEEFFRILRSSLDELKTAYERLVEQVMQLVRAAFGALPGNSVGLREELAKRYQQIAASTSDVQIRAMGVRLEHAEGGNAWLESLAALLSRKPLESWQDEDVPAFEMQITDLGRRFRIAEQVALAGQRNTGSEPIYHIGLHDGHSERGTIVRPASTNPQSEALREEIGHVMQRYGALSREQKIALLTDMLKPLLEEITEQNGHHEQITG